MPEREAAQPVNPAAVRVKPRHDEDGQPAGEEVYYRGFFVGLVCRIQNGRWLGIPSGTKRLREWAGVPRYEKRIDAVKYLADLGAERLAEGREGAA